MPSTAPTSHRFLTLFATAGLSIPVATHAQAAKVAGGTAEYCRLLNELPSAHRHAYLHAAQPDGPPQRPYGNLTPRDDAQMKEARRLLKLEGEIPSPQKFAIERAFLDDHPEDKRAHDALHDAYRQGPVGQKAPRIKDLFDDTLRIRRQMRRDCGSQPG